MPPGGALFRRPAARADGPRDLKIHNAR